MAASSFSSFLPLLLLLFLTIVVESRPSPHPEDVQVHHSLFSSRLSSLLLAPPTFEDVTDGSGGRHAPTAWPAATVLNGRHQETVPRFFLDFLQRHSKMRRQSRKSMVGRGCFGMKMDRIGSISGLGC